MIENVVVDRKVNNLNGSSLSISELRNIMKMVNKWQVDSVLILLL